MNVPSPRGLVSLLVHFARFVAAAALFVAPVRAQGEAHAELFARRDGNDVRAAIRIAITPGWHLYHDELGPPDAIGKATKTSFEGAGFIWSKTRFPEPIRLEQPGLGEKGGDTWIWGHEGTIVLFARASATGDAKLEELEFTLNGLTCEDEGSCVPYRETIGVAGKGDDALFAAFPSDLVAQAVPDVNVAPSATTQAPSSSPFGGKDRGLPKLGRNANGLHASAKLFVRKSDSDVETAIEITIEPGFHLYHDELGQPDSVGKPTIVEYAGAGFEWSAVRFPTPKRLEQPGVGDDGRDTWIWGHEGKIVLWTRGRASSSAVLENVAVAIRGLTCEDNGSCVEYAQSLVSSGAGADELFARFPNDLVVPEGGARPRELPTQASTSPGDDVDWDAVTFRDYTPAAENTKSLLVWLFFAFIAGMLLNVMPCVLPVVSIKVLSFVQQAGENRSRILALGLSFSAGILVVFFALASLAAFAGKGWGEQFQNETFKVVMIAIVFAFALSLFDVFELGVPSKVGELAAVKREGLTDAFFKGIMATLLATPCSGPFLGSTLAWALAQKPPVIFAVFASVGLGMAAPYAVLTSNPALLRFVPRPGAWMKTFKHLMGFLLMGTVIFLLISVRQDLLLLTATLLVFVALGCWWWGNFATFDQTPAKKLATLGFAAAIVAGGAWFSFGTMRAWFSPVETDWETFDPRALERYHDEGRNVFVDFTANWCLTCKSNEKFVYKSPEIQALFAKKGFAVIKADETGDSPRTAAIKRLREQLGARSIPFMAIFPGDDWLHPRTLKDVVTRGEVRALIDACPTPSSSEKNSR
ncbi:MAG: thioredoxin family protein [Planctomycetes bacterium]|nr:thioredoxin family protein [Planctomycetota bacterium]